MNSYNQNSQSVNNQINVGRDQVIHNLVLVGQFLDFAKIEGLIPKPIAPSEFTSIIDTFDNALDKRLGGDLEQATALAGVLLSEVMHKFLPKQTPAYLPARNILQEAPDMLYKKIVQTGLWNTFYSVSSLTHRNGSGSGEVLWLYSLQILWKKYFKKDELIGIAQFRSPDPRQAKQPKKVSTNAFLCIIPAEWKAAGGWRESALEKKEDAIELNIDNVSYEQFRIILAGLVVDLIRICSIASDDIKFWQSLISLMNVKQ